jgi:hypothetical protein
MSPVELGTKNHCAGRCQHQFRSQSVTINFTELQLFCDEADIAYNVMLQIREFVIQGMIIFCLCKKYRNLPENAHFN